MTKWAVWLWCASLASAASPLSLVQDHRFLQENLAECITDVCQEETDLYLEALDLCNPVVTLAPATPFPSPATATPAPFAETSICDSASGFVLSRDDCLIFYGNPQFLGGLDEQACADGPGYYADYLICLYRCACEVEVCQEDAAPAPTGVVPVPTAAPALPSIVDIAVATDFLSTLVAALTAADLVETLAGPGPFTVFAPTDDAFLLVDPDALTDLLADVPGLTDVLLYHVISGTAIASSAIQVGNTTVTMVNGDDATISFDGATVTINDATVTIPDIFASNGVVHVIDRVLFPPSDNATTTTSAPTPLGTIVDIAVSTDFLSTLVTALAAADLVETLAGPGPFTVFAPTDDAFALVDADALAALLADVDGLTDVLLYHVIADAAIASSAIPVGNTTVAMANGDNATISFDGATVTINDATVTIPDVVASNGVVHVIDQVLFPPADDPVVDPPPVDGGEVCGALPTLGLTTLATALEVAGLCGALDGVGPFTVFAPTDEAFAELSTDTLASLLNSTADLGEILLYHVISGEFLSADLPAGTTVIPTLLDGASLTLAVDGSDVSVDGTPVLAVDAQAGNVTVHTIGRILLAGTSFDCTDSVEWYKTGDPSKDCAWAAMYAPRCDAKGFDQTFASYACPSGCDARCGDSASWYKRGDPSKDCAWVSVFPEKRCAVKGEDRVLASAECPVSCARALW